MNTSMQMIYNNVFKSFRRAAMIMFGFIFFYAPLNILLEKPEARADAIPEVTIAMVISAGFSILMWLLPKAKFSLQAKIAVATFSYLLGLLVIHLSVYPTEVVILPFLFLSFIPVVLLNDNRTYITYVLIIGAVIFATVVMGDTTASGKDAVYQLRGGMSNIATMFVVVAYFMGVIISAYIRRSIQDIFNQLNQTVLDSEKVRNEQRASKENLLMSVNDNKEQLHTLSSETNTLLQAANQINDASEEIAQGSTDQSNRLVETKQILDQLAQSIEEMSDNMTQVLEQANQTQQLNQSNQQALSELQSTVNTSNHMNREVNAIIETMIDEFKQIIDKIKKIDSIAGQTNLLALNASIESARAGEAGRGFAVVAEEIRKLAEETSQSAHGINDVIHSIENNINRAQSTIGNVNAQADITMSAVTTATDDIQHALNNVTEMSEYITQSTERAKHINDMRQNLQANFSNVAAMSEQYSATTQQVSANVAAMLESLEGVTETTAAINENMERIV